MTESVKKLLKPWERKLLKLIEKAKHGARA